MNNLQSADEYSFLVPGDKIPDFTWEDEAGQVFSSKGLSGKYTFIILFAADCRHCRDNFAYLEKNLFSKSLSNLNILAFGRDCDYEELESYRKKYALSVKLTADPNKEVYSKFAEKAVPRNFLFNPAGELLISVRGYRPEEIENMIRIVSLGG
jgi:peroxiredoxin